MELTLPDYPADATGQLIYLAALVAALLGLAMLVVPRLHARLFGMVERPGRNGAYGEIRAAGGFLAGLALSAFLFQDQPELPLALGIAFALAVFGRILALMSDHATSLANLVMLLLHAGLAACLMMRLFEVWTPDSVLAVPEDPGAWLAFLSGAIVSGIGAIVMFAPRIAMLAPGLSASDVSETALGPARAFGGLALGTGLMVMASGSIMIYLAFGVALVACLAGRLVSLVLDRGNWLYHSVAGLASAGLAILPLNYVLGLM